jgi:hypothetical protein
MYKLCGTKAILNPFYTFRMPCACVIPIPAYPDTSDWGPILWSILHGLAEKSQRNLLASDELREWSKFLKLTGDLLPCEACRVHYHTYTKEHPFTPTIETYGTLKVFLKQWFWNLHNEVNVEKGKPVFPYESLEETYKSVNLQDKIWQLKPVLQKAIQLNGVSLFKWKDWYNSFLMLRSLLSF